MTNTFKGVIRQGDVLLLPIIPTKVSGKKLSHLTLAQGEVTGHSHRISKGQAELYERNGTLYLKVLSQSAILNHEEHRPLEIPHGNWMIKIQREYHPVKNTIKPVNPIIKVSDSPSNHSNLPKREKTAPELESKSYINQDELLDLESQELHELAAQIDVDYWEKLVRDAEKRKEYLDRIQKKQTESRFEEEEMEEEQSKKPVRKKIKYVDYSQSELPGLTSYRNVSSTERNPEPFLPGLISHLKGLAEMKIIDLPQQPQTQQNSTPKVNPSPRKLRSPQPQNWRSVVD